MAVSLNKDPAALAKELNKFITDGGGQEIPGLDQMDPKQLSSIRDGLKQFLDNFDQAKGQDPELAKLADGEALKSLRTLAQIASEKAAAGGHMSSGMCGGGGGQPAAPPPPPAPPPVSSPESPKAPPPVTATPTPTTPEAPNNGAPIGAGPLSTGTGTPITLSQQDISAGTQQVNQLKVQLDQQRSALSQQRGALENDIRSLASKPNRTPQEEALLTGKRQQLQVLQGTDANLQMKKQGLDAAAFAMSDGVITPSELQDLQTISRAVQGKDVALTNLGTQANDFVARMQGPLASNGSNFDPMSMNAVATAGLLASALGGANALAGVFAPGAGANGTSSGFGNGLDLGNLANLGNLGNLGNLADLGNLANPLAGLAGLAGLANAGNFNALSNPGLGSLGTPSRIGSDASLGTDASLEALGAAGGGGGFFEDRVFAIMCKVVEDFQKKIEERLNKLQEEAKAAESDGGGGGGGKGGGGIGGMIGGIAGSVVGGPVGGAIGKAAGGAIGGAVDGGGGGGGGGASGGAGGKGSSESRNIEFEKIKFDMQKLSQMQQAMSNVLNSMDELAKNAIHHIKAG